MTSARLPASEARIVWLLTAVSFVNILDFMMVMPLGPDFAVDLGISTARLGLIGGAYTFAAAIAGLAGMAFLDRFDRKFALLTCVVGLGAGTLAGSFAQGLGSLIAARLLAGAFGGPATSLALSICADVVPPERRGKAVGTMMGAFAAASVLGVPTGLELARWGSWRLPFVAVAALAVVAAVGIWRVLPSFRGHIAAPDASRVRQTGSPLQFLDQPGVKLALTATALVFFGNFSVIPNLSTYIQYNLEYPRESLGLLYLVGGGISFFTMRLGGAWVDRQGPNVVTFGASALLLCVFWFGFMAQPVVLPVIVMFVSFMMASSLRGVALNTLSSLVPTPETRARYMSADSATKHLAAALGAGMSSWLLIDLPDHRLGGMPRVVTIAMVTTSIFPVLVWLLARRLSASRIKANPDSPGASGRVV